MRASYSHLTLVISCFIFLQCNTSKKIQEPTNDEFGRLVKRLQKDPAEEKSIALLTKKYITLRQSHLSKIETLEKDQSVLNIELIFKEYTSLQQYFSAIQAIPGLAGKVRPVDYTQQLQSLKEKLITGLDAEANHLLKEGDKASCRQSYYSFLKLQKHTNDPALEDRIKQSLQCGSITISIEQPQLEVRSSRYNFEIESFYRGLVNSLQTDKTTPFIRIVSSGDETDESIHLYFTQFTIGAATKDNNSRDVVNNQATGGRRSTAASPTYSSATITTTRTEYLSIAALQMEIVNKDGAISSQQQFNARHEWNNEVNTYTGDRRALSSADRAQLRNPMKNPPSESEIVNDLLKQLTERILTYLQSRYASL